MKRHHRIPVAHVVELPQGELCCNPVPVCKVRGCIITALGFKPLWLL